MYTFDGTNIPWRKILVALALIVLASAVVAWIVQQGAEKAEAIWDKTDVQIRDSETNTVRALRTGFIEIKEKQLQEFKHLKKKE